MNITGNMKVMFTKVPFAILIFLGLGFMHLQAAVVSLSSDSYEVLESSGELKIPLNIKGTIHPDFGAKIRVKTADGSASSFFDEDYTRPSPFHTFHEDETTHFFIIQITPDDIFEGDETFEVEIQASGLEQYTQVETPTRATVTILESGILPQIVLVGGRVEVYPEKDVYQSGDSVTVTAVPNAGNRFVRWSGEITGINPVVDLEIHDSLKFEAIFEELPVWWSIAEENSGYRILDWFGWFAPISDGWIYHFEHGWVFTESKDSEDFYCYDFAWGWWWSSHNLYPNIFRFDSDTWYFYYIGGNPSSRYLYNHIFDRYEGPGILFNQPDKFEGLSFSVRNRDRQEFIVDYYSEDQCRIYFKESWNYFRLSYHILEQEDNYALVEHGDSSGYRIQITYKFDSPSQGSELTDWIDQDNQVEGSFSGFFSTVIGEGIPTNFAPPIVQNTKWRLLFSDDTIADVTFYEDSFHSESGNQFSDGPFIYERTGMHTARVVLNSQYSGEIMRANLKFTGYRQGTFTATGLVAGSGTFERTE